MSEPHDARQPEASYTQQDVESAVFEAWKKLSRGAKQKEAESKQAIADDSGSHGDEPQGPVPDTGY